MQNYLASKAVLSKLASLRGIKKADDTSSSTEFEKAFSNLVMAVMIDQFPQLSERMLGFQVIEKSEDERKAIGVMGLDIGGKLALAPFFFNKGELVGNELLWLAEGNIFVPKIPEWIDHLMMHHHMPLGTLVSENIRPIQPTMDFLRFLPTKAASADWLTNYLPDIAYARYNPPRLKGVNLERAIANSPKIAAAFIKLSEAWPAIKLYKSFGVDRLLKIAKGSVKAGQSILYQPTKRQQVKTAAVEVLTTDDINDPRLSVEDKIKLKKNGYFIIDKRKAFSKYAKADDVEITLREQIQSGVSEPGIYKVLCGEDGKFHRALVIPFRVPPRLCSTSRSVDFAEPYPNKYYSDLPTRIYVEFLGDKDEKYVYHPHDLLVQVDSKEPDEKFHKALEKRSITPRGIIREITNKTFGDEEFIIIDKENSVIRVVVSGHAGRDGHSIGLRASAEDKPVEIKETPTGNIVFGAHSIFVPPDARAVPITYKKVKKLNFTGRPDILQKRVAKGDFDELVVIKFNKDHYAINGEDKDRKQAISDLLIVYGLSEKSAEDVLNKSTRQGTRWIIEKQAEQISLDPRLTPAPGMIEPPTVPDMLFGSQVPTKPGLRYLMTVSSVKGIMPVRRRANEPLNPELVRAVQEAAQTGQKEVFDTTTLSSLLSIADDREIIDKHLPDVLQAVDALGRILFTFYWHSDDFEKRYGQYDVERIKNMLSAQFKQLGKLAVMLKEQQQTATTRHIDEGTGEFGSARELG